MKNEINKFGGETKQLIKKKGNVERKVGKK
jgi:hypothetical protein